MNEAFSDLQNGIANLLNQTREKHGLDTEQMVKLSLAAHFATLFALIKQDIPAEHKMEAIKILVVAMQDATEGCALYAMKKACNA